MVTNLKVISELKLISRLRIFRETSPVAETGTIAEFYQLFTKKAQNRAQTNLIYSCHSLHLSDVLLTTEKHLHAT